MRNVGKLLKTVRADRRLQQKEVARILGISSAHLSLIEQGMKKVSPARAAEFAKMLNVDHASLVAASLQDRIDLQDLPYKVVVTVIEETS